MSPTITTSEWMAALEAALTAQRPGDPGVSVDELAAALGHGPEWIRAKLRTMKDQLIVGRKGCTAIDGRQTWTPCYRLKAGDLKRKVA
jgi:hypothetical protein